MRRVAWLAGLARGLPARPAAGLARRMSGAADGGQEYRLRLTTGNRRGAGTTAQVFVQLFGRQGVAPKEEIDADFVRASVVDRTIVAKKPIGPIRAVRVGHNNVGEMGVGWYLERVELEYMDDATQETVRLNFPVRRWLGKSDAGRGEFPHSVKLKVGVLDSMTDPDSIGLIELSTVLKSPLHVETGAAAYPHPDKVKMGEKAKVRADVGEAGEDAYAVAQVNHPDGAAAFQGIEQAKPQQSHSALPTTLTIAVADGVFSWRNEGIDAGEWSRFLVQTVRHQTQHHVQDEAPGKDGVAVEPWHETYRRLGLNPPLVPLRHPLEVLEISEAKLRETDLRGSSTACVAAIHGMDRQMYIACLGDSGVFLFRAGAGTVFRTPEQEHSFGYPYQLGHHAASDAASDALVFDLRLTEGDVVLVASDGLFDNLSDSEIEGIVAKYSKSPALGERGSSRARTGKASECARELVAAAFTNSLDKFKDTPYSRNAAEEYNLVWHGGKRDDITVVCALVS